MDHLVVWPAFFGLPEGNRIDINFDFGHHDIKMRTTLDIESDVLDAAKSLAAARGISVGAALSELARRGVEARTPLSVRNGFPVFRVDPSSSNFGPEDVEGAMNREDKDAASGFLDLRK